MFIAQKLLKHAYTDSITNIVFFIVGRIYSCFEKGCPTKPYATIPKGIMGTGGSCSLVEVLGVSVT